MPNQVTKGGLDRHDPAKASPQVTSQPCPGSGDGAEGVTLGRGNLGTMGFDIVKGRFIALSEVGFVVPASGECQEVISQGSRLASK